MRNVQRQEKKSQNLVQTFFFVKRQAKNPKTFAQTRNRTKDQLDEIICQTWAKGEMLMSHTRFTVLLLRRAAASHHWVCFCQKPKMYQNRFPFKITHKICMRFFKGLLYEMAKAFSPSFAFPRCRTQSFLLSRRPKWNHAAELKNSFDSKFAKRTLLSWFSLSPFNA